jgi:outer membrane protein assembly factor BamA
MRILSRTSSSLAVLLLIFSSHSMWGQTYSAEKIAFSGSNLSQGELLTFTGLRPGEVTRETMQAAADRLTGSGLFTTAKFELDGTTLTFDLQPSPGVVAVQYDNFPWWTDKALNDVMAAKVPLFHGELYPGGPMREQVTAVLVSLLATKDVRGATISTAPVGDADGNQVAIRYHIDTPPIVIAAFHIYGYSGVWTQPVEAVEKAAFRQKIDETTREKLAAEVRGVYGRLGFIDMQMTEPVMGTPQVVNGEIAVPASVSITSEGGQYHVAGIRVQSDSSLTQAQLEKSTNLHAGDVADADRWKQLQEAVKTSYRMRGYLKATIDAKAALDRAQHTVDYTITVEPGAAYRMGQLTLANLDDQQKAELMPYWLLHKGDVFNPDLIGQSISNYHGQRAHALQSIRTGFTAKWSASADTDTVDVVLTFDQK